MNNLFTAKYHSLSSELIIYPHFSTDLIYKMVPPSCFQQTPALYIRATQIPGARSPWHKFLCSVAYLL